MFGSCGVWLRTWLTAPEPLSPDMGRERGWGTRRCFPHSQTGAAACAVGRAELQHAIRNWQLI